MNPRLLNVLVTVIAVLILIFLFYRAPKVSPTNFSHLEDVKKDSEKLSPETKVSKGEKEVCRVLAKHYGVEFKSYWLKELTNPDTGRALQIDCYNPTLKIGAEYDGRQHDQLAFGNTYEDLLKQIRRDRLKDLLAYRNGIYLMRVSHYIPHSEIEKFLLPRLPPTNWRK